MVEENFTNVFLKSQISILEQSDANNKQKIIAQQEQLNKLQDNIREMIKQQATSAKQIGDLEQQNSVLQSNKSTITEQINVLRSKDTKQQQELKNKNKIVQEMKVYTISLKKQNSKLEKDNKELGQQIQTLESKNNELDSIVNPTLEPTLEQSIIPESINSMLRL